jgi:PAS domain S-box-containing protein
MNGRFDKSESAGSLRNKIIGLGEESVHKNYYSQLQQRIEDLENTRSQLAMSEARYRLLVENISDVLYSLDTKGIVTYISPVIKTLSGFSPEEFIGKPFSKFFQSAGPDTPGGLASGYMNPSELTLLGKDGSLHYLRVSSRPVTEDGLVTGLIGTLSDLTEQKRAEQNIALLNFALNSVHEAAYLIDETGRFHFVNEEACRALGYTREELLGMGVPDIDPSFPMERWSSVWDELKMNPALNLEGCHRRKDGTIFPVEVNASYFEYGDKAYNLALVRDITERKQTEESIKFLASIVKSTDDAVIGAMLEGEIVSWNNGAEYIYGYTAEKAIGQSISLLFPSGGMAEFNDSIIARMRRGEKIERLETQQVRAGGQVIEVSLTICPIKDAEGELIGVSVIARDITARKRAEEALQMHEQELRTLIEHIPDFIVRYDKNLRRIYINPAWEKVSGLGFGGDMLHIPVGSSSQEMVVAPTESLRTVQKVLESGTLQTAEYIWVNPRGESLYLEWVAVPLHNRSGQIDGVLVVGHDLSERKRAEEALRRLNRELRAISDCNQALVRATDEQQLLNEICHIVCEKAGYRMAWVGYAENDDAKTVRPVAWAGGDEGYVAAAHIVWDDTDYGRGPIGTSIRTGKTAIVQDFATDSDVALWQEMALERGYRSSIALPLKDESDAVFGALTIYSSEPNAFTGEEIRLLEELSGDLAFGIIVLRGRMERSRVEAEVRRLQSEERYRQQRLMEAVLDSVESGIVACDANGLVTMQNRKARELLGLNAESGAAEMWAKDSTLYHADGKTQLGPEEIPLLRSLRGEQVTNVEVMTRPAGYEPRVLLTSGQLLRDNEGKIFGAVEALHDITELKTLEVQLRHSQKLEAVGQLAAGIAHEINTPAQFIGDNLLFLKNAFQEVLSVLDVFHHAMKELKTIPDCDRMIRPVTEKETAIDLAFIEENVPPACDAALDGVSRISGIVGAMKEFAHTDRRKKAGADLNRALKATFTIARNEYKYVADLESDLAELPLVMCHLSDLNQVFLNLLLNASHAIADVAKSSSERGKIHVRSAVEGNFVRIEIQDTGCGIPEQIRDRIFEPFFTTKEVGRGTGQGLAIARSIVVDKHHGSLTFTSETGKGTTFIILLPIDGKPHPLPKPQSAS